MKWETIFALVVAGPILALFCGAAFLMLQIGHTWDSRSTDTLITGLVATCGGGMVVIGMLLAIIVGIPFAIRMFSESGHSRRSWQIEPPVRHNSIPLSPSSPFWNGHPPLLTDKQQGSWQSVGQKGYDLWTDQLPPNKDDNFT